MNDNGKKPDIPVKNHGIVFEPPTDETPGFLRLQRRVLRLSGLLNAGEFDEAMVDDMVELLLPFVVEPADRDEAREALLDASKKQYQSMLNAVVGKPVDANEGEVAVEVVPPA